MILAFDHSDSNMLEGNGNVWITGYGKLGDGSNIGRFSFKCAFTKDAKAVAVGNDHGMVVKQDGSVWVMGQNVYGQLGAGSNTDQIDFVKVQCIDLWIVWL